MNKKCEIFFWTPELKEKYLILNKGITPEKQFFQELNKAFAAIGNDAFCGRQVKKEEIPKKYDEFENLWIYNLSSSKRLIYTISSDDNQIVAIICDWFETHKEYDKAFGHRIT